MLRIVVAALLLANLVFFAWARGWLSPWMIATPAGDAAQREPQRLAAQIRPESIVIVDESTTARASATLCLQAGPFDATTIVAAEAALQRLSLPPSAWQRQSGAGDQWWLRLPAADAEQVKVLRGAVDPALARGFGPCL